MKAKKQTDKRKRSAQAVAVSDDELRAFADGVEKSVDGWRCVDVDAFRREVVVRGVDDLLVLEYVRRLQSDVSGISICLHSVAERISGAFKWWKTYGKRSKEIRDTFAEKAAAVTKINADYIKCQKMYCTTFDGIVRRYCVEGLDYVLRVPVMGYKGNVRILNLDSIMPGASKVWERFVSVPDGLEGDITDRRLFELIARWFVAMLDALYDIEKTLQYDRLSAAMFDLRMAVEGLPDVFAQGRIVSRGDLKLRIDEAKKRLAVVCCEIAAADVARGAKGGAGIRADGSKGVERQGKKVCRRRDTSPETMEIRKRLIDAWNDYKPKSGRKTIAEFIRDLEEFGSVLIDDLDKVANDDEKKIKGDRARREATAKRLIDDEQRRG